MDIATLATAKTYAYETVMGAGAVKGEKGDKGDKGDTGTVDAYFLQDYVDDTLLGG